MNALSLDPTTDGLFSYGARDLETLGADSVSPMFWRPERLGVGSAWWEHVPFGQWIVCAAQPRVLVELGTHMGVSYTAFCQAVLQARLATACYAVDTWRGDAHAEFYGEEVLEDFRRFHDERYASFSALMPMTFDEARGHFPDGAVDLLHIDGFHTYEAVAHDFESWRPKLSDRAVVLFHDINERRIDFGAWRLWAELRQAHPHFEFLHGHGLGVLALGRATSAPVQALCAITEPSQLAAVRNRFAVMGDLRRRQTSLEMLARDFGAARAEADACRLQAERGAEILREAEGRIAEAEGRLEQSQAQARQAEGELALTRRALSWMAERYAVRGHRRPSLVTRLARRLAGRARVREAEALLVLCSSVFFDAGYYLSANADVRAAGMDPALHYLRHGAAEGRDPSPWFSTLAYLQQNPDVARSGDNPVVHHELHGRGRGRLPPVSSALQLGPAGLSHLFSHGAVLQ